MAIEGHTDASGSAQRNLMLSWDRAMTVFKLLVERYGIDPVRLQPVGKGSMGNHGRRQPGRRRKPPRAVPPDQRGLSTSGRTVARTSACILAALQQQA